MSGEGGFYSPGSAQARLAGAASRNPLRVAVRATVRQAAPPDREKKPPSSQGAETYWSMSPRWSHPIRSQSVASLEAKHPEAAEHLDIARNDLLAFTGFPRQICRRVCPTTCKSGRTRRSGGAPAWSGSSRPRRDASPRRCGADGADRRV